MFIIETKNIVKKFDEFTAVAGIDLRVESGECFGLLGPNGAGKTTLVRMITGVSPITSGEAWVAGLDVRQEARQIKALIGVVPQEENLDPDFSVMKNLQVFARYYDIPRAEARKRALAALEMFDLSGKQQARIRELSGGMKRRLLISRGLINRPLILVLDEPSVGLDPQGRLMVWQKLKSLQQQNTTLLLTTQNMEEAAVLCDRLAIINEGKIIASGTPRDVIAQYGGKLIIEARLDSAVKQAVEAELTRYGLYWQEMGEIFYIFKSDEIDLPEALQSKLDIVSRRVPTLEDVFLRLTGRALIE